MITSFKVFENNSNKQKEFTVACGIGDVDTVKQLIKDVDPTVDNHWALQLAALNGHLEVVKTLLEDPRVDPSADKNYAIIHSARGGYLEIVKLLLKDPRVDPTSNYNLPIRYAAKFGHLEIFKLLLQDKRVDPSDFDNFAIQSAATFGHDDIVYLLLNDPRVYSKLSKEEIKDYAKGRPLVRDMIKKLNESNNKQDEFIKACKTGDLENVKKLINVVDPSASDNLAIRLAAGNGHLEIVKTLLQDDRVDPSDDNNYAIQTAAQNGHLEIVKTLLQDSRVDPSDGNDDAIQAAARNGHLEIVKTLLQDSRVDPSARNNFAIQYAALKGHLEVVKTLLQDKRVDPSANNNDAIQWAAKNDHDDIVYLLLNDPRVYSKLSKEEIKKYTKGRPLVRDMIKKLNEGNSKQEEFRVACKTGHLEIVKALLKDDSIDPSDEDNLAIRLAVEYGHLEIVKTLLQDKRVDPSDDNNDAIQWAAQNGHLEIVKTLLQDNRVDPSDEDNWAIIKATRNGHLYVVKLLLQDSRVDPTVGNNYPIGIAAGKGHDDIVYLLLNDPRVYSKLSKEEIKKYTKGRPLVRDMIKKMNEDIKIDGYNFNTGDCDIFAISLHRLHGYPLCAVRGKFLESEWDGEKEWDYEYCHIVVKLPNGNYMDSNGEQTKEELIADCHFSEDVKEVDIVDIKENDAMGMFSCTDQEEDIKHVMKHLKKMKDFN